MSRNTKLTIPFFRPFLGRREIRALNRIVNSGWLTTGPETEKFEGEFRRFLSSGADSDLRSIAVNSATAGLHLALEALGIGPGDKVAVPTLTFTASAEIITYLGAEPVFVDSVPETGNIDPAALKTIAGDIKAVICVHLAGHPCGVPDIRRIIGTEKYIIEDAAHAFPSRTQDGFAGTLGDVGVFSFYATKTITTGEGGMVVCRDPDLERRMKTMRLHGIDRPVWNRYGSAAKTQSWEYDVVAPGYKYNLTDLAAAIGRVQLERADRLLDMRKRQVDRYNRGLAGIDAVKLPKDTEGHAWHLYIVRLEGKEERNALARRLHDEGIGSSVHFIPLHRMSYWKDRGSLKTADFPVAEHLADRILSLPLWPGLKSRDQERIIRVIRDELR